MYCHSALFLSFFDLASCCFWTGRYGERGQGLRKDRLIKYILPGISRRLDYQAKG